MDQVRVRQVPRSRYFPLLQYPSSPNSLTSIFSRTIFPVRFLFLTRDDFFSIFPDTVIPYDQVFSGPRKRSLSMSALVPGPAASDDGVVVSDLLDDDKNTRLRGNGVHEDDITLADDPVSRVFECFGLLESILLYNAASEVIAASAVSRRWYEAGRNDTVWKQACLQLWQDKCWMPVARRGGSLAIFWRSMISKDVVDRMTVKEIRSLFAERPLGQKQVRDAIEKIIEKSEMNQVLLEFMPDRLGCDSCDETCRVLTTPFRHMWFGSYASSVIDSSRSNITVDELCCQKGFDMHFKVLYDEEENQSSTHPMNVEQYRGRINLHFHSTCYFIDTNNEFRMEPARENDMMTHNMSLTWRWVIFGREVQVGPYPPLLISRRPNWGWRLENYHVVLYSHE